MTQLVLMYGVHEKVGALAKPPGCLKNGGHPTRSRNRGTFDSADRAVDLGKEEFTIWGIEFRKVVDSWRSPYDVLLGRTGELGTSQHKWQLISESIPVIGLQFSSIEDNIGKFQSNSIIAGRETASRK